MSLEEVSDQLRSEGIDRLEGQLVKDDKFNDCIRQPLKKKSRVKYKCMDLCSNLLAFGTSSGAIYLFSVTRSSSTLLMRIPCDQGSIEVIKILYYQHPDNLLIIVGTIRGSLVIFNLIRWSCSELYKAESFTGNSAIRFIEYEQCDNPSKIYICDAANKVYGLDSNSIYPNKDILSRLYSTQLPELILRVDYSNINQLSVHDQRLLISTDETTRLFDSKTGEIVTIGNQKRKEGVYGASFFRSSQYKTLKERRLLIFVSRPKFYLWKVDDKGEVELTYKLKPSIDTEKVKSDHFHQLIPIYSSVIGDLLYTYNQDELFILNPLKGKLILLHTQDDPIVHVSSSQNELLIWSSKSDDEIYMSRLVLSIPSPKLINSTVVVERPKKSRTQPEKRRNKFADLLSDCVKEQNGDFKRVISSLKGHKDMLNDSVIPIEFYLKVIASATLVANPH